MKIFAATIVFACSFLSSLNGQTLKGTLWTGSLNSLNFTLEFGLNDTVYFATPVDPFQPIAIYSESGNQVKINDFPGVSQCNPGDTGTYSFTIQNNILDLTVISDVCSSRSGILDGAIWTRAFINLPEIQSDIKVFPNPFSDRIYIEKEIEMARVNYKIMDLSGRIVSQGVSEGANHQINTEQLDKGNYIIYLPDLEKRYMLTKASGNE